MVVVLSDLEVRILLDNLRFVGREGKYLVFFCPFHPDQHNPNFKIHTEKRVYRCFRCGEYGPVIKLLRQFAPHLYPPDEKEKEEIEKLKILEDVYHNRAIDDRNVLREIYERRRISWTTIEKSKVKFLPDQKDIPDDVNSLKRRFIFPVLSFNDRLLNVVGWSPYVKPPYVLVSQLSPKPYGLHLVGKTENEVWVCEGVMDSLSFVDCGLPAVATLGGGVHPSEVFSLFPNPLVYSFDGDRAGKRYTFIWSFTAVKEKRFHDRVIVLPDQEDPNSLHQREKLFEVTEKSRKFTPAEIVFYYSLKHEDEISPFMVIQFLAFQLPLTHFLDLYTQVIQKKLKNKIVLPLYTLNGSIPSDYISEQLLSDWSLICSAATTFEGREVILHYFLPSEVKPLLDNIPVKEGGCRGVKPDLRAACKRVLYLVRKPQYNKFRELIETVKRLEV
ncbi:MAG: CHC2 zinc finger domain-containing protein [Candidatus Hadarchaeales archaeon]